MQAHFDAGRDLEKSYPVEERVRNLAGDWTIIQKVCGGPNVCANEIKLMGRIEGAKSTWRHPDGTFCTPNKENTFEGCDGIFASCNRQNDSSK